MASCINLRTCLAFSLVLALHASVILAFHLTKSDHVNSTKPLLLQFVPIIKPIATLPRPQKGRTSSLLSSAQKNRQTRLSITDTVPASDTANEVHLEQAPLSLDSMRTGAAQQELNRERSAIELQNEKNHQNRSLEARAERGTQRAQHTDCRTAHASTGLLAPLFIAADLLADKGCKF